MKNLANYFPKYYFKFHSFLVLFFIGLIVNFFLSNAVVARESCNLPLDQGDVYTVKIGEDATFTSTNCSDTVNPVPLAPPDIPVDQTSASALGNLAEASVSSRPGYRAGATATVGVRFKWDLNGQPWEKVKDIPVTITANFSYKLQAKAEKPAGAVHSSIGIYPIRDGWYKEIANGPNAIDEVDQNIEVVDLVTTVGSVSTVIFFTATAYAGIFCILELPDGSDGCAMYEGYSPNEASTKIEMKSIKISFTENWDVKLSLKPSPFLLFQPHLVVIDVTNNTENNDYFSFIMQQSPLVIKDWFNDQSCVLNCNFPYRPFFVSYNDWLYPTEYIIVGGKQTKTLLCEVIHIWNWCRPPSWPSIFTDLGFDIGIEWAVIKEIINKGAKDIIAGLKTLNDWIEILLELTDASGREINFIVRSRQLDANVEKTIRIGIPESKIMWWVLSIEAAESAKAFYGLAFSICKFKFLVKPCALSIASGVYFSIVASLNRKAAVDPRDDFMIVAQPEKKTIGTLANLGLLLQQQQYIDLNQRLVSLSEAALLSYARFLGARNTDSDDWAQVQLVVTLHYVKEIDEILEDFIPLFNSVFSELPVLAPLSREEVSSFLETDGLTPIGEEIFRAFQVSDADISGFKQSLLLLDDIYSVDVLSSVIEQIKIQPVLYQALIETIDRLLEGSLEAIVMLEPKRLSPSSLEQIVTAFVEFPEGINLSTIDGSSIRLNGVVPAEGIPVIGDYDNDGILDLAVTFARQSLEDLLNKDELSDIVILSITGKLLDGKPWGGVDVINIAIDSEPPTIMSVTASPNTLWPPNHKMVSVTVVVSTSDNSGTGPICKITSVTSNEPDNGLGDGDTANDIVVTGDLTVNLRAERSGTGTGRVYTVNGQCTDTAGNSAPWSTTVTVPHDKGKK